MLERKIYKPSKGWWSEVAELDNTLFSRGERDNHGFVGKVADKRSTVWSDDGQDLKHSSARVNTLIGEQNIGSDVIQVQKISAGDEEDAPSVELLRIVTFIPTGVYARGRHGVTDHQYTFYDLANLADRSSKAEEKRISALIKRDRKEQNRTGFAVPTEETYVFILDKLKQGEEATRHHDH